MPGPPKKPDRQRRNADTLATQKPTDLRVIKGGAIEPGDLDPDLYLPETIDWWNSFWNQQELLLGLGEIDIHLVRRLASLHDLRERALREVQQAPMLIGSQGQKVENPMGRALSRYDSEVRQIEDRLGLNPRGRLNLGITFGQARKSIEDLLAPEVEDGDGDDRPSIEVV